MSIHSGRRRALAALLAALLLLCAGCQRTARTPEAAPAQASALTDENLSAAVVYGPGERWRETLSALENSTLANLTAAALPAEEDFSGYDLVIPDPALALAEGSGWPALRDRLMDYVQKGGFLVLDNSLWSEFPRRGGADRGPRGPDVPGGGGRPCRIPGGHCGLCRPLSGLL